MTSETFISRRRPSAPAGWLRAKSSALKFLAMMSAPAIASPKAIVTVVDAVGAKLSGQASRSMAVTKATSATRASELRGFPVMAMIGMPIALRAGTQVINSLDSPENEMPTKTSPGRIMPRSPWAASSECTKNEVVPVEENVAASLRPMCPDLPTPEKMTLPLVCRIRRTAATNGAPKSFSTFSSA